MICGQKWEEDAQNRPFLATARSPSGPASGVSIRVYDNLMLLSQNSSHIQHLKTFDFWRQSETESRGFDGTQSPMKIHRFIRMRIDHQKANWYEQRFSGVSRSGLMRNRCENGCLFVLVLSARGLRYEFR